MSDDSSRKTVINAQFFSELNARCRPTISNTGQRTEECSFLYTEIFRASMERYHIGKSYEQAFQKCPLYGTLNINTYLLNLNHDQMFFSRLEFSSSVRTRNKTPTTASPDKSATQICVIYQM